MTNKNTVFSLLAQKRTSLLRLVQNKFKILTLLLNGTYVNTLYEVLLTEWVDDHERIATIVAALEIVVGLTAPSLGISLSTTILLN